MHIYEPATTCDSKLLSFSFNSGLDKIMSKRFSFKFVQNHNLFLLELFIKIFFIILFELILL